MVSFLFQPKESLGSFAPESFGSEIQSERQIYTEEIGYWSRFWVVERELTLENTLSQLFLRLALFYRGVLRENAKKSASLTLSRCILKSMKRRDTHINDSHGRDLSIGVIYF